ncbi:unnamed protein product [Rotaria sordida]|uniref:Uncharacterized protein n=1 Tax=Rotaria sordida TaxID=392033 RepID=A0A813RCN3_9BILA|nr:unnamed protein product [Rotaria sordida]CAF4064175.1 unnamed protein product [Rotaria sordida]
MEYLVGDVPPSDRKDELEVDLLTAKVDILSWMFHTIRGVQQDKIIDRCLQNMSSVRCIFERVIDQIKQDLSDLTTLYIRSDNAGCYSGTAAIISRQVICASAGICLKRADFSEP